MGTTEETKLTLKKLNFLGGTKNCPFTLNGTEEN
jgi:hypothetical protein